MTVETWLGPSAQMRTLIEEVMNHKKPGGDLLTVTVLPARQRELLAAYVGVYRNDVELPCARLASKSAGADLPLFSSYALRHPQSE